MTALAIGLCGKLGSGKSLIADELTGMLACPLASFGRYVRSRASERGLAISRATLQDLGAALLRELGARSFSEEVLRAAGWRPGGSVVVDGVRHLAVAEAVRDLVQPVRFHLVYLDIAENARSERLRTRDGLLADDIARIERHSTEVEVEEVLRSVAPYVADAARDPREVAEDIIAILRGR